MFVMKYHPGLEGSARYPNIHQVEAGGSNIPPKNSSVGFPDKLTELLNCSSCNGNLHASGDVIECKNCSTQFPVTDRVVRFIG